MKENQDQVNYIAQTMEDILSGHIKRCPECEELLNMMEYEVEHEPDEGEETIKCLQCGHVDNWQEFDADLYDYLADNYGISYTVNGNKEYQSVRLTIAYGGPNIFVDTSDRWVSLYWWSHEAHASISKEVSDEIDDIFEELYRCS